MTEIDRELDTVWTTIGGLSIHARISRRRATGVPAVVLVHGVGVSGRYMLPTAGRLTPFFPTYVPDLPGFGKSEKPGHILDIPELADALAAWMRAMQLANACLVGNSLGCQTIVDLALRYPELIGWAVLVGPTVDSRARTLPRQLGRGALDMLGEPLGYWPLLLWEYLRSGPIRTIVTLRHGLQDPLTAKLPQVRVPTLVVRGSCDPIAPQPWCEEMVRLLPLGRLLVIAGATHVPNYTRPDALTKAIREFLTRCPSSAVNPAKIYQPAVE